MDWLHFAGANYKLRNAYHGFALPYTLCVIQMRIRNLAKPYIDLIFTQPISNGI